MKPCKGGCGRQLRNGNVSGYCYQHPQCMPPEGSTISPEKPLAGKRCERCGGPVGGNNITGVCRKNILCRQENSKRNADNAARRLHDAAKTDVRLPEAKEERLAGAIVKITTIIEIFEGI